MLSINPATLFALQAIVNLIGIKIDINEISVWNGIELSGSILAASLLLP